MTTWDSGHKGASISLSNGDLTATQNTTASTWYSVISTTGKASGKYYCKFTSISHDSLDGFIIGVGNSSTSTSSGAYIGSNSAQSAGFQSRASATYGFVSSPAGGINFTTGNSLLLAVDRDNKKAWLRVNGAWSGSDDPSTNTGGRTWTFSGDVYLGWSGFDGAGSIDHVTMDPTATDSDSKLSGFTVWDLVDLNIVLNKTIAAPTLTSNFQVTNDIVLNATIAAPTLSAHFDNSSHIVVNATISNLTANITFGAIESIRVSQTIPLITGVVEFSPKFANLRGYIHFVETPFETVAFDPFHDPIWVAVEVDVFDDTTSLTIRLSNRGVVKRTVSGVLYQYQPRLQQIPLELGTTITVTSYGSPVRGQPNGGIISFAVDESIWPWFAYRWIGQRFRVYTGTSADPVETDVDEDLRLIYVGRVASLKHDTLVATIQTTDETIQWDNPLVTNLYGTSYTKALREKPKPYLWGYGFGLEPQIEVESTQTYGVSHRIGGLDFISEVRVGGIPWRLNVVGPPRQGEWTPNLANGTFALGSPPLGMDVRCDAQQGNFTVAGIIRSIIEAVNGEVDDASMAALDVAIPGKVSYATGISPVNLLDAIDDLVTSVGCWWAVGPLGKVIAGVIDIPSIHGSYILDETNIKSISLNTIHPPAWKIRIGYQRNWSPESSFAPSVLQTEQKRWSEAGQVVSPKYENTTIKTVEPRAVDVPLLTSTLVSANDAHPIQQRLIKAWGTVRSLYDVTAFIRPEDIILYDTVAVDYMMVKGNFRITSAIRVVGEGPAPATLQLWGTIGKFGVEPPIDVVPKGVGEVGIWTRNSGSGVFEVGVDSPSTVTQLWVRGIGGGGGGGGGVVSGFQYGGGGGGAGGYFEDVITVTASSVIDWSVGEGGDGQAYGAFSPGGDGGDTTFGGATGFGGGGGHLSIDDIGGGDPGGASGATVLIPGGNGGPGYIATNSLPFEVFDGFKANGASSLFGQGCFPSAYFAPSGASGTGGGGHVTQNPANSMPGNNGLIIVVWFSP